MAPADAGGAVDASVIVSTFDERRWDDLEACVSSLLQLDPPPLEVIVVVDHNNSLLDRAREAFPECRVIPNERPQGLAGARNSGVAASSGSISAFIDDDARAESDWISRLSGAFDDPTVIGAGGGLIPNWADGRPGWMPDEFLWVVGCSYTGLPTETAQIRNPIGANMAVRREVHKAVGGFREGDADSAPRDMGTRGMVRAAGNLPDDTDFAIRVSAERPDGIWLYRPDAVVHHSVTHERSTWAYFMRRSYEEGVAKANLAKTIGGMQALSLERRHTSKVLPRGVLSGLADFLRGNLSGLGRAAAILAGLAAAGTGFAVTSIQLLGARKVAAPGARKVASQ